ncbi:hypothetical protein [Pseudocnuella soli]|uniref:hypothetical protein n=1 Tax=Pseudocnuella soli TaxID=2502779 RepID=UPI001049BA9D|nr:hypothetical protein [Pseudocnuella soli]
MKAFLPLLMLCSATAFAQNAATSPNIADYIPTVLDANTYGYVNGIRLDSVNATYARFGRRAGDGLFFDYGQVSNKRKELNITDRNGKQLVFVAEGDMARLNFFWFNGWQLHEALTDNSGNAVSYILRKRN